MKRPSFQFYPGDWLSNANLLRCTLEERGAWLAVLCLLHDQEEYGMIRWPLADIAQATGCPVEILQSLHRKGVLKGSDAELSEAFIYTPRSGRQDGAPVTLVEVQPGPVWYSSRMVKDEHIRNKRSEAAEAVSSPKPSPKPSPMPPIGVAFGVHPSRAQAPRAGPSSSSSLSSSKKKSPPYPPGGGEPEGFAEFWAAYPKKVDKDAAKRAWKAKAKTPEAIQAITVAAVAYAREKSGTDRQYVKNPATWLNAGSWMDENPKTTDASRPAWALAAGFTNRFDANNAGCREHNAAQFRDGKLMTTNQKEHV